MALVVPVTLRKDECLSDVTSVGCVLGGDDRSADVDGGERWGSDWGWRRPSGRQLSRQQGGRENLGTNQGTNFTGKAMRWATRSS